MSERQLTHAALAFGGSSPHSFANVMTINNGARAYRMPRFAR